MNWGDSAACQLPEPPDAILLMCDGIGRQLGSYLLPSGKSDEEKAQERASGRCSVEWWTITRSWSGREDGGILVKIDWSHRPAKTRHILVDKGGRFLPGAIAEQAWEALQTDTRADAWRRPTLPKEVVVEGRRCAFVRHGVETGSVTANGKVYRVSLSLSGRVAAFCAGTKVWVVTVEGSVIQQTRVAANFVMPDKEGGVLAFDGVRKFTKLSPAGQVVRELCLKGESAGAGAWRGDFLAITSVSADQKTNTVRVVNLDAEVLCQWRSPDGLAEVGWAPSSPVLIVRTPTRVCGFSIRTR